MRVWTVAAVAAVALAAPAAAQLGAPTKSPPPDGIAEGAGSANPKGHYAELDALPDWGGIWFVTFALPKPGDPPPPRPQLKAEYAKQLEDFRQQVQENDGVVPRARSNCSPPGMPRIMRLAQYPYEFIFAPGRVTINQEAWMQTRTIWTDGREHDPDHDPGFMGDSIGHWEGDTLVVDTVGISGDLEIDTGIPHSEQFHLVERIHLDPADADVLVNEMTMDDPEALEAPFKVTTRYRRDRYGKLLEFQCSQNDRNPVDENGHTLFE
ncbi:hypothetical protein GRI89_09225 [Altererythrobacter salegens]|uniref:Uncharacterized protein n=1 Tax=Croceibacterium salegens TaxID=1737568 RepID=A0A6I4SWJ8_9SPHN|nr:hypothetical protein [Croceibacterium salegens]MXO59719.1 hypothetical protein [Croceibacterium salegens]